MTIPQVSKIETRGKARGLVSPAQRKVQRTEIACRLLTLFRGRKDYVAVGDEKSMRCRKIERQLSAQQIAKEHLTGKHCFAIYVLCPGDVVVFSGLDFDNKADAPDPRCREKSRRIAKLLTKLGLSPVVEQSQGGCGAHIWLFFSEPVPAWLVREFWRAVLSHLEIAEPEIFPRQDSLDGKKVGNAIRIPLFNKSRFVEPKTWKPLNSLQVLKRVKKVTAQDLEAAAEKIGCELVSPEERLPIATGSASKSLPWGVRQLLSQEPNGSLACRWNGDTSGLTDTSRSSLVFSIASNLIRCCVPTDQVESAIRFWCAENNYAKGQRDDWIQTTLHNAYEYLRESGIRWRRKRAAKAKIPDGIHPSIARDYERVTRKRRRRRTSQA